MTAVALACGGGDDAPREAAPAATESTEATPAQATEAPAAPPETPAALSGGEDEPYLRALCTVGNKLAGC